MINRSVALPFVTVLIAVFLTSNFGIAAEIGAPTSEASPASEAVTQAQPGPKGKIDPVVGQLLNRSCDDLASSNAFTFHAEITFDQVLPSNVKLQFAAAADYAVQRPDQLAVDFSQRSGSQANLVLW